MVEITFVTDYVMSADDRLYIKDRLCIFKPAPSL